MGLYFIIEPVRWRSKSAPNIACSGRWGLPLRGVRHFQALFWLRVFSTPKQNSRPPQCHATRTHTVGRQDASAVS